MVRSGQESRMTDPAAQPRRVFLAFLVLVALAALVVLLASGHLVMAVVVGVLAAALLVTGARPRGASD
jgi:predicted lysophospholipase L1 biosynthesis ABC-type transport system permease subunit